MGDATTLGLSITGIIFLGVLFCIGIYFIAIYNKEILKIIVSIFSIPLDTFLELFANNEPIVNENCSVFPTGGTYSKLPSLYLAHIAFFFGFLLINALDVYNIDTKDDGTSQYANRKARSKMIIIVLAIVYLILLLTRYFVTDCESPLGILATSTCFLWLSYGWYKLAATCGIQTVDLLGMSSSIL